MNQQVVNFLWRVVRQDILTPQQVLVLRELFTDDATERDCVRFIEDNKLVTGTNLEALKLALSVGTRHAVLDKKELASAVLDEGKLEEPAPDLGITGPDPGVEWFCYIGVTRGLLTREVCLSLLADLPDETSDLLGFAQSCLNYGMIKDLNVLQKLTDEALEGWARGRPPPFSVFTDEGTGPVWEKA